MPTLIPLLVLTGLIVIVASATSAKVPLWVGVFLMGVALLLMVWR
jgi:hypothetical protein